MLYTIAITLNKIVHKLMRGRCWCPRICIPLSEREILREFRNGEH